MRCLPALWTLALLLGALAPVELAAESAVDDLVRAVIEDIDPADLGEIGNPVLAERLSELLEAGLDLPAEQEAELRLRVVEAWLDAEEPEPAARLLEEAFAEAPPDALRQRAGLDLVALWELQLRLAEEPEDLPDAVEALRAYGEFPPTVVARAWSVNGQRLAISDPAAAIAAYDEALDLLGEEDPATRVPIYTLRIVAMERQGMAPKAVQDWLADRADDPAVAMVMANLLTDGDRMIGQPAPPLVAQRVGPQGLLDEQWQLADHQGKKVLVYFFATWCAPCATTTPAVVQTAAAHEDLVVVGVSLDTRDSIANLDIYRNKYGVTYPIVGEVLGWDGELEDAWHVTAIPTIFLVDEQGRVLATELVAGDTEATVALIDKALGGELDDEDVIEELPPIPEEVIP